jgi:amino acid transporter
VDSPGSRPTDAGSREDATTPPASSHPTPLASTSSGNASDASLDAGALDDAAYLEKLGYKQELNRALGLISSFGVQFSSISVGSALFTTLVVGLGFFGPASFWSYLIGGAFQVLLVGLAMAQLVSAYPLSGGVYQIATRLSRKPWLGWQCGWMVVIAHTVAVTSIAVSIVPFVAAWFGADPQGGSVIVWTIGLILLVTVINLVGVKITATANNIGVIAEIACVVLAIGALLFFKHPTQPLSVVFDSAGTAAHGWITPLLLGTILPAYLISSFDATGNAAEETRDAARTAPRGTSIANISAWVVGSAMMLLLIVSIPDVRTIRNSQTPAQDILSSAVGTTVTDIFIALAVIALIAAMAVLQLTGVRVLWSQARDGQLPGASWLRKISAAKVPINATFVLAGVSILIALWSSLLAVLAALTALAWALSYGVVVALGLRAVLRKNLPSHPWHYGKFSPVIFVGAVLWSIVLCVVLVVSDPIHVGLGMVAALVIGALLYLGIPKARRGRVVGVTDDTAATAD